jgi:hypothetical protein
MYQPNILFSQPTDPNVSVWRYMDFTKYVALLSTRKLFFARADKLGDPFEGSFTKLSLAARIDHLKGKFSDRPHMTPLMDSVWRTAAYRRTKSVAVSCWHMSQHESTAMWSLYLRSGEGVAIRSTYASLQSSLEKARDFHLGQVKYIDYDEDAFPTLDELEPFIHKRKSFEHEREVRALVVVPGVGKGVLNPLSRDWAPGVEDGVSMPIDLRILVHSVCLSPTASGWFKSLVTTVNKRFRFDFEIDHSTLTGSPLY